MDFKEFKDLVKNTRTTRRFKKNISIFNKDLEEIIDTARVVSSAMNKQPLKYIIVTKKKLVEKLSSSSKWASHLENWTQSKDEQPSAYIIVLNDSSIDGYSMLDCGIALNTIMLGLKLKGFASCPLGSIDKELCKNLFSLSKNLEPILGIAVGIENETVKLVDLKKDTNYYRDENDTHCVPKRVLKDILIKKYN
ncbi:nitroreductase family protein [Halarcobacter anaerophilus]|uniref:Nitroreductase n=1 Tax=Halarcobacter anaerophilus TaxID=877500 RepID=A0A4Q0Y387_9BACT|nr:nitroreductase family protein [Halarcobacter anaerophilus]QDF29360.1 nitroreductase family protein [Halarcobacter anaerophilus]RXJ64606.1 nitroreductase [Halarcobacter anaerophilus]